MKHLIILFDGTWNSAATGHYDDITNVFRLNLAISRHDHLNHPQIVFYVPGPGTTGLVDEQLGGAFGQGIDQIIREAYVNLASNYCEGDKIYLFGFSRGAVAARALSCLIADSGLLKPQRLHLLPIAWKRFVNLNQGIELHAGLKDLTKDVHHDVRIKFLGAFDSVLGRIATQPTAFSDLVFSNNRLSPIVDKAFQLLSIDDNRKVFLPLLWDDYNPAIQEMEQIWLPGVHGDVGGIGSPHFLGIVSLLTMIGLIQSKTEIKINDEFLNEFIGRLRLCDTIKISDERVAPFWSVFAKESRIIPEGGKQITAHPVVRQLHMRNFVNRGSMTIYDEDYLTLFLSLPVANSQYASLVEIAAKDALLKMH